MAISDPHHLSERQAGLDRAVKPDWGSGSERPARSVVPDVDLCKAQMHELDPIRAAVSKDSVIKDRA